MRHFYIGPAPFWYLWFSVPDNLDMTARAFVDTCAPWFAIHNGAYNPTRTPWRVRCCALVNAPPVVQEPPFLREWSFAVPNEFELSKWHAVHTASRRVLVGSAASLEPAITWGPMSLAYIVRDEAPAPTGPWRFWFGAPLRGQAFWRAEILRTTDYGGNVAGSGCREVLCLDGITPPQWSDDLADRLYSYTF